MTQHHFTVDVEEYFQVSAFERFIDRGSWDTFGSRIDVGVDAILQLLDDATARGTFFVLGWLADRRPDLVRRIAAAGHEIGSHGWNHARVTELEPHQFREQVVRSKRVLEDASGVEVLGFRAPSFSITPGCEWALEVLLEEGYDYDSSLFPIRRPGYGYPGAPREPHRIRLAAGSLFEFPLATVRLGGVNIPAAGGGYLRHFPFKVVQLALQQMETRSVPGTLYIHPWELDLEQPRLPVPWLTRRRHYGGLAKVGARLRRLLQEYRFTAIRDSLPAPEVV